MSHEITKKQSQNFLVAISDLVTKIGLNDVKQSFNSKAHLHRRVETTVPQLPEERVGSRNVRFQCCQPARQSRGRNGESPLSEPLILEIIHNCLRLKLLNVSDVDGYSVHA